VELDGFRAYRDSAVRLSVAQAAQVCAPLDVGNISDVVEVRGAVSLLNLATAARGTVMPGRRAGQCGHQVGRPIAERIAVQSERCSHVHGGALSGFRRFALIRKTEDQKNTSRSPTV